ncbi:hypothetical protein SDC9_23519 [bioreactor metagenome]|uniref:Uncharacterized protein n=1 Tax=bioreactor metagenome TaxID=1076179 RepID=A0A644UFQ2_9ZZZZ
MRFERGKSKASREFEARELERENEQDGMRWVGRCAKYAVRTCKS